MWHRPMRIYGVKLRILALCCRDGQMLYLAYQGHPEAGLRRYAQRWQCENLHQSLKGRGFNLEESGLSRPERVSTLMGAVGLAFVWCCLTGEYRQKQIAVSVLSGSLVTVFGIKILRSHLSHLIAASGHVPVSHGVSHPK